MLDIGIRLALCAGLSAALGGAALAFGHHERDVGRAEVRAEWKADQSAQQRAVIADQAAAAAETQRRLGAMQRNLDEAHADLDRSRADADSARAAFDRLRQQQARYLAAVHAGVPASDPASAPRGDSAGLAADLFSDLFSESDEGAGIMASALDLANAAGLACQRAYSALTQH